MYVTVEGWRLWVSRRRPTAGTHCRGTVLLLHGFPDTHALWDSQVRNTGGCGPSAQAARSSSSTTACADTPATHSCCCCGGGGAQVAALTAAGWATIAPDMPGFGRSAQPQEVGRYKLGALVSLMLALLDQLLGAGAAAAVVAHDWGAAVAWALALRAPERVQRLVVLSVGHPGTYWPASRPGCACTRSAAAATDACLPALTPVRAVRWPAYCAGGAPDPAQRARRWYQLFFLLPGAEAALGADGLLRQVLGADRSCSDAVLDEYVQRLAQPGAQ